jgi:hypothetical protein
LHFVAHEPNIYIAPEAFPLICEEFLAHCINTMGLGVLEDHKLEHVPGKSYEDPDDELLIDRP